jgi:hypothetical protein
VSGQLHAPAALPPVPTGWEAEWDTIQVWTTWREKSYPYQNSNSVYSVAQPVAIPTVLFQLLSWRRRRTINMLKTWTCNPLIGLKSCPTWKPLTNYLFGTVQSENISDGHCFFTFNHSISPKLHYILLNTREQSVSHGVKWVPKSVGSGTLPGRCGHHTRASDITWRLTTLFRRLVRNRETTTQVLTRPGCSVSRYEFQNWLSSTSRSFCAIVHINLFLINRTCLTQYN